MFTTAARLSCIGQQPFLCRSGLGWVMVASSRQADKPYSATRKWAEGNLDLYFLVVSMSVLHRRLRLEVKMSLYLVGYILFEKDEFFQSNIGKSPSLAHCSMHSLMSALHVSSSDDENSRKFR